MQLDNLSLSKKDKDILEEILSRYSNNFEFYAFGSRVQGNSKEYSDLDVAYILKAEDNLFKLKDEIEESNISITLDFVNLQDVSEEFRELIESQMQRI